MKHSLVQYPFILAVITMIVATVRPAFSQTAPRFTAITTAPEGSITLTLTGAVLTTYTILATTNLNTPFSAVGVLVTGENGSGSFTDAGTMTLNRQRFYRAQQLALNTPTPEPSGGPAGQSAITVPHPKTQSLGALRPGAK